MVLKIFRLNKDTSTEASFEISKTINFKKLTLKGYSWENFDYSKADKFHNIAATDVQIPTFLCLSILDKSHSVFYQGRNFSSNDVYGIDTSNMIPLGVQGVDTEYKKLDFVLINKQTSLHAGESLIISLKTMIQGLPIHLTNDLAFGSDNYSNDYFGVDIPMDHGVNLFFEFDCECKVDNDEYIINDAESLETEPDPWIDLMNLEGEGGGDDGTGDEGDEGDPSSDPPPDDEGDP